MPEAVTADLGEGFAYKRVPMKEKTVRELNENDIRVAIIGTVVNVNGDRLVLDDGTDSIEVLLPPDITATQGALVRVVGRVRSAEGLHIETEFVQRMDGLDISLYKSLKSQL